MFLSSSKVYLWSRVLSLENKEAVQESVLERICLKAVKVAMQWFLQNISKNILVYNGLEIKEEGTVQLIPSVHEETYVCMLLLITAGDALGSC